MAARDEFPALAERELKGPAFGAPRAGRYRYEIAVALDKIDKLEARLGRLTTQPSRVEEEA